MTYNRATSRTTRNESTGSNSTGSSSASSFGMTATSNVGRSSSIRNVLEPGGGDPVSGISALRRQQKQEQWHRALEIQKNQRNSTSSSTFQSVEASTKVKKESRNVSFSNGGSNNSTIRVVAPATLNEGYCFDVMVNGKPFTVTVPLGGVFEGEEFDVEYYSNARYQDHHPNINNRGEAKMPTVEPSFQPASPIIFDPIDPTSTNSNKVGSNYDDETESKTNNYNNMGHGAKMTENNINRQRRMKERKDSIEDEDDVCHDMERDRRSRGSSNDASENNIANNDVGEDNEEYYDDEEEENDDETEIKDYRKIAVRPTSSSSSDDDDCNTAFTASANPIRGKWRTGLFSCCDVLTQATFWMTIFCTPIMMAQLITRLRLNYLGRRLETTTTSYTNRQQMETEISLSYNKIILTFICVLVICNLLPGFGIVMIGVFYILIIMICLGKNVRNSMRRQYKIPSTLFPSWLCCICRRTKNKKEKASNNTGNKNDLHDDEEASYKDGGCYEDCICMTFCGCCSIIQMARHTHNDKDYPGYCCTTNGLEVGAPEIIMIR